MKSAKLDRFEIDSKIGINQKCGENWEKKKKNLKLEKNRKMKYLGNWKSGRKLKMEEKSGKSGKNWKFGKLIKN